MGDPTPKPKDLNPLMTGTFPETMENWCPGCMLLVIASQRVGAKRRPMTGSAKQSGGNQRRLDCFVAGAARNDGIANMTNMSSR
jgi:hypothetical protein